MYINVFVCKKFTDVLKILCIHRMQPKFKNLGTLLNNNILYTIQYIILKFYRLSDIILYTFKKKQKKNRSRQSKHNV